MWFPILHRNVPEVGEAESVVHDAGALMTWLVENEGDLVLHGHMHLPAIVKQSRALDYPAQTRWHEITIAALGSSGVTTHERPQDESNSYGLLRFGRAGMILTIRKISADDSTREPRELLSVALPY